jgi:hypothetical protein
MSYGVDGRTTMASKVLGFLVESGTLYIFIGVSPISAHKPDRVIISLSQVVVVASAFIRLCFATLGDILVPVAVQLAVRTSLFNDQPRTLLILFFREFIQLSCSYSWT